MKEGGPETFVIDPYDKKNIKVQKRIKCHLQHRWNNRKPKFWWHERIYMLKTSKFRRSKERKLKGKVYLIFTIEKTEVFLSLEFFATWVMERRGSNSRYKTIPTLDSGTDNKPVRVEYSLLITIQTD
jgi:hypothetical protein